MDKKEQKISLRIEQKAEELYRKLFGHWNESSKYDGKFWTIKEFFSKNIKEV